MSESNEMFEDVSNPLDSVEDILSNMDWVFDRPNEDELSVTLNGRQGQYRMTFIWQEEYSAMQFFCELDSEIPADRRALASCAMQSINARLWLGHFVVQDNSNFPCFRHTSMFRGWTHTSGAEHVEDLVDIAIAECDRYAGVFGMLSAAGPLDQDLLGLALSESAGEA